MSKGENVSKIELFHWILEERSQYYYEILLFDYLPRMMVVKLIITECFYVN